MSIFLGEFLYDVHQGLRSLIFPQICIMCGMHPGEICSACEKAWSGPPSFTRFNVVPSVSIAMYESGVSSVILKAKEERNKCAQMIIAMALLRAISFLKPKEFEEFVIVPIPSTPHAIRRRGESFLQPILDLVIQQAAHVGEKWYWRELLVHSKKVRDQAGLTSQQRQVNLEGVFRVREGASEQRPIIVVDDVVTTGATLRNAISALNERKMTVLGVATACASSHQLLIR